MLAQARRQNYGEYVVLVRNLLSSVPRDTLPKPRWLALRQQSSRREAMLRMEPDDRHGRDANRLCGLRADASGAAFTDTDIGFDPHTG